MKQLIQNFKTGELYVDELPMPALKEGMVLVQNAYSLISAGTEGSTVKIGRANLINKARQRPDLVRQVIDNYHREGLQSTWAKVRTKLDSLKALGYSTSGTVLASLDSNHQFKPGDRVACAGQDYASHSEVIAVPQNLVVKIPDSVSSKDAAFTTLGAIALQGIRQTEPTLGETICVIGLGLLGQLTCELLKANGCRVFGIDLNDYQITKANERGTTAINRNCASLIQICKNYTNGHGFDSVIITAASNSNDPIELASEIVRKKGKVVVVGSVKMDIPRDPHFYRKELELRMACSYGPGRYDVAYEEEGHDYPIAYVRWTEQRNMLTFVQLLESKAIEVSHLITHIFSIEEANQAFDLILNKHPEPHLAILLKYDQDLSNRWSMLPLNKNPLNQINVGFIGAGSFAQSYLIPMLKKHNNVSLEGVVTTKGLSSKNVGNKFGFNFCSTDHIDVIENPSINTVFIATTHSSHSDLCMDAVRAGKNVFVEKPLAINEDQLAAIIRTREAHPDCLLMVGFNRRFAPLSKFIKNTFNEISDPIVVHIRVNAGHIPGDHWIMRPGIGGGRVIGEICHFVDLIQYFTSSFPTRVYADSINSNNDELTDSENLSIVIKLANGSIGNIVYYANGDKSLPKEYIEISGGNIVGIINDFRDAVIYRDNKSIKKRISGKGHQEQIDEFLNAICNAAESPIPFESLCLTTLTTFRIMESLQTGLPQTIHLTNKKMN